MSEPVLTPLPRDISRRLVGSTGGVLLVTVLAASVATTPQLLAPAAEGLRDAGLVSDLTAPAVRGLRVLGAVVTVGALVIALLLGGSERASALKIAASRWAVLWAAAAGGSILLEVSQTSGVPISDALNSASSSVNAAQVTGLTVTAWLAAVVAFLARRVVTSTGVGAVLLVAASALVTPVLTGHSGHAGFNAPALAALALHVLAVSAWTGGLLALCAHADAATRLDIATLRRFSSVALVCYVVVVASGVVNVGARLSVVDLVTDGGAYSVVLLLKVVLFVGLGLMGLAHRRRFLASEDGAAVSFWSLAVAEVAVMAAALGLAVSLTATAPGRSDDEVHAGAGRAFHDSLMLQVHISTITS